MEKYDPICRLCCSTLDLKNCLLKINDQYSQSRHPRHGRFTGSLCKTCYGTVFAVQKAKRKINHARGREN